MKIPLGGGRELRTVGRVGRALNLLALVTVGAWVGYMAIGLSPFDALYQTVVTVTTVGYAEVGVVDPSTTYRSFTLAVMILGVGTTFYTFGVLVESLLEGRLEQLFGRRRMDRQIAKMSGHVVVCGGGRVGRELVAEISSSGRELVVIDLEASARALAAGVATIDGDATDDGVLRAAGIDRAAILVTALANDSDNLFVTLSARSMRPNLFIVARSDAPGSGEKLFRAGADRVVNPQFIGGRRMATYALSPNVAEFLDVTMNDGDFEWSLAEATVGTASAVVGSTLGELHATNAVACMILAARVDGEFLNNPGAEFVLSEGVVLIAMGEPGDLDALRNLVGHQ